MPGNQEAGRLTCWLGAWDELLACRLDMPLDRAVYMVRREVGPTINVH